MPKWIYHVFYRWLSIFKYFKFTSTRISHSPRGNYPKKWLDLFKYTFTLLTYPRKGNVICGYTKIASEWLPIYCVGWVNLTIILLWELIFFHWALAEIYLSEWVISYIPRLFNSSLCELEKLPLVFHCCQSLVSLAIVGQWFQGSITLIGSDNYMYLICWNSKNCILTLSDFSPFISSKINNSELTN